MENEILLKQLEALVEDEPNQIANLANASALLAHHLSGINWVGFYLLEENTLVLGPFQGAPACTRIPVGKGVCGTAAMQRHSLRVLDVCQFPGHIACDPRSRSELVIPLIKGATLLGVLDIDSPDLARFSEEDEHLLCRFAERLTQLLWP